MVEECLHPDDFLLDQLDLYHAPTVRALVEFVEGYDSPSMTSCSRSLEPGFRSSPMRPGPSSTETWEAWLGGGDGVDV